MSARNIARVLAVAVAMTSPLLGTLINAGHAAAGPCSDVEVVFARGTDEAPGVGGVGQAFVDSLRSQAPGRSLGVYAVNYPATYDFARSMPAGPAMRAPMSNPRLRTAPTPKWCSVDILRAPE